MTEPLKIKLPGSEFTISYPKGYVHPHPVMRAMIAEMEALDPLIDQARQGTAHDTCTGWRVSNGQAYCGCGAPLEPILRARLGGPDD